MINYYLPIKVTIDNEEYFINKKGDYRVVLDVISALNDDELTHQEKIVFALCIFYDFNIPDDAEKAVKEMLFFINRNENEEKDTGKTPIMNWEQDFDMICDDINAKYGVDIRGVEYLHWWTMLSYFMGIGEGQFSTVVGIRRKKNKGIKLEKWEHEYYNENRSKVDLNQQFNEEEKKFLNNLLGLK